MTSDRIARWKKTPSPRCSLAGDETVGLGLWSLVAQADPVVKVVLLLLVLRLDLVVDGDLRQDLPLRPCRRKARASSARSGPARALDDLYRRLGRNADHPMAMLFAAAMEEWRDAAATPDGGGARDAAGADRARS